MYNLFLDIAFSTVCTAFTIFLLGCDSAPDMQLRCKADPPTVRGKGIAILSVDVPKIKGQFFETLAEIKRRIAILLKIREPTALTFTWKQLEPEEYKGKFSSRTNSQVKFLAPEVPDDSIFTIQVTAEDKKGVSHACNVSLVVEKKTTITWDEDIAKKMFGADKNQPKKTPAAQGSIR